MPRNIILKLNALHENHDLVPFVIAKHLIHFILVNFFIEPAGATWESMIPIHIQDTTCESVEYLAKTLNHEITLFISRKEGTGTTSFLLHVSVIFVIYNFNKNNE